MRVIGLVGVFTLASTIAASQGVPGTNLTVDVEVAGVSMRGDTTEVTYVLWNRATSTERLFRFMVDAPSPVLHVSRPEPRQGWSAGTAFGARSVASWAALGQRMLPGQQSPPLVARAVGLPAIVTSWARGYTPPSADIPSDTLPLKEPPSIPDSTVGVEPFPADRNAANLLVRLRALQNLTCGGLGWITSAQVCADLGAKVDNASQALGQGDTTAARNHVTSFVGEVRTQHGSGLPVNDSAYWLLTVNGEYILGRL